MKPTSSMIQAEPWRDLLARRISAVLAVAAFLATVGTLWSLDHLRGVVAAVGLTATAALSLLAVRATSPRGAVAAWTLVGSCLACTVLGYSAVGFLAGPTSLLGVTLLLAGVLLGRGPFTLVFAASAAAVGVVGASMVNGWMAPPPPEAVSATNAAAWQRTLILSFMFLGLSSYAIAGVVQQLDLSVIRLQDEQRRRAEAELETLAAQREALEAQARETMGSFASGIAHDLNNSLVAVIGSAELLADELGGDHPSIELARAIRKAGVQANGLIRQLLASTGQVGLQVTSVDVGEVVHTAATMFERMPGARPTVSIHLSGGADQVVGDLALLQAAVLNLLVNARDATPENGRITVHTRLMEVDRGLPAGPYVTIEVADTGCGIAPEHLDRVFDPFFSTKDPGKGMGLGLAAVAGTARVHLGDVRVESGPHGSTFRLLLPCVPHAKHAGQVCWRGLDPAVRQIAAGALQAVGYTVADADDPRELIVVGEVAPDERGVPFDPRRDHLAVLVERLAAWG